MPLLDHFHSPLSDSRRWESFHAHWAASIAAALNEDILPNGYFAEIQVHLGSRIEVDVGTFADPDLSSASNGGATTAMTWAPPAPTMVLDLTPMDEVSIHVFNDAAGPEVVAAIELISPRNAEQKEARRAFASKCFTYLVRGMGLMIIDVVTNRSANLHNEVLDLLQESNENRLANGSLYATAFRPVSKEEKDQVEIWPTELAVNDDLPTLPLSLRNAVTIPVDLEATYTIARQRSRLA